MCGAVQGGFCIVHRCFVRARAGEGMGRVVSGVDKWVGFTAAMA